MYKRLMRMNHKHGSIHVWDAKPFEMRTRRSGRCFNITGIIFYFRCDDLLSTLFFLLLRIKWINVLKIFPMHTNTSTLNAIRKTIPFGFKSISKEIFIEIEIFFFGFINVYQCSCGRHEDDVVNTMKAKRRKKQKRNPKRIRNDILK